MVVKNYMAATRIKQSNKSLNSLIGLFIIGLIFIVIFFIGNNASLLRQDIANWPKARAKVIAVDHKIVCETPEKSGACYAIFLINYSYEVNGKKYTNQFEQTYATSYSPGKMFYVYYKIDDPQLVFPKEKIPTKFNLYLPLFFGLFVIIPIIILWMTNKIREDIGSK